MQDEEMMLDLSSDPELLRGIQDIVDRLYDDGHLDIAGSNPVPIDRALHVLAANGGDPILSEELLPLRRYAGNEAMRTALDDLLRWVAESERCAAFAA